jgi:hypothetical protein
MDAIPEGDRDPRHVRRRAQTTVVPAPVPNTMTNIAAAKATRITDRPRETTADGTDHDGASDCLLSRLLARFAEKYQCIDTACGEDR